MRTKKGLRTASQIVGVSEKGLVSAKTIKQVFSASAAGSFFERINARAAKAIGAK